MAAEMPARVQPVENAVVVNYPWDAATRAVAALNAASSTLDGQLGTHEGVADGLHQRQNNYRAEHAPVPAGGHPIPE